MPPKYTVAEVERRWLVELGEAGSLAAHPCREIEDRYLTGTRLRLRKVTASGQEPVFKLGKKYGKNTGPTEPVVSVYLTQLEHNALSVLAGTAVRKTRYQVSGGSLDVYVDPHPGLAVFEVEFPSEAAALEYKPPGFVREEITHNASYSGFALSQPAG